MPGAWPRPLEPPVAFLVHAAPPGNSSLGHFLAETDTPLVDLYPKGTSRLS